MYPHVNAAAEFHREAIYFASVRIIVDRNWRCIYFRPRAVRRADQSVSEWLEALRFTVVFYLHPAQKVIDALRYDIGLGNAVESVHKWYRCRVTGQVRLNAEIAVDVVSDGSIKAVVAMTPAEEGLKIPADNVRRLARAGSEGRTECRRAIIIRLHAGA